MIRYLPALVTASIAFAFTACETPRTETVQTTTTRTISQEGRDRSIVEEPDATPRPRERSVTTVQEQTPVTEIEPSVTPMPTPVVEDYPTASSVEGKPGFVKSPFGGSGIVDVRGYPPGTEVKDPYTGKVFLVP